MPTKQNSSHNPRRTALQQYWSEDRITGVRARATLRTLQFAAAVVVVGLYAADLASPSSIAPTNWIYAEVVGVLSILTCALHGFMTVKRVAWIFCDLILCVLWAACAGVFGMIYLQNERDHETLSGRTNSLTAMKVAFALDVLSIALWLFSFLQGTIWCCRARRLARRMGSDHQPSSELECAVIGTCNKPESVTDIDSVGENDCSEKRTKS